MNTLSKRATSAVAALCLGLTLVPLLGLGASAGAEPGPQTEPTLTVNPVQNPDDVWGFDNSTQPTGAFICGGTGGDGYRGQTFIVNEGVDIATLPFNAGFPPDQVGADQDASDGSIAAPLWYNGAPQTGFLPATSPAGQLDPGLLGSLDFADPSWNLVDGTYQIGIACIDTTVPALTPQEFWVTTVTIDADASDGPFMFQGEAQVAPTNLSVVPDSGQCTVSFDGSADEFRAEADDGTTVTSATGTESPITITGLTNGTSYDVTVVAIGATGEAPSAPVTCVPETNGGPPQTLASVVNADGTADVTWAAPASPAECTLTGYDVTSSNGSEVYTSPDTAATVSGADGETVKVTVTSLFDVGCVGAPASIDVFFAPDAVIYQDIDVTRPVGGLVLTQVCDGVAPTLSEDGADADGQFDQYPYPTDANGAPSPVPTHCGVDMGTAEFITSGDGAGQYFAADGVISPVTIVDTRNVDAGWVVTGTATDFASVEGDSFSGDLLGWTPVATSDTDEFTPAEQDTYDQVTEAGSAVTPNTVGGLNSGETLGSAAGFADDGGGAGIDTGGLGIAIFDANLSLLIPVTADSGVYESVLNITAI